MARASQQYFLPDQNLVSPPPTTSTLIPVPLNYTTHHPLLLQYTGDTLSVCAETLGAHPLPSLLLRCSRLRCPSSIADMKCDLKCSSGHHTPVKILLLPSLSVDTQLFSLLSGGSHCRSGSGGYLGGLSMQQQKLLTPNMKQGKLLMPYTCAIETPSLLIYMDWLVWFCVFV